MQLKKNIFDESKASSGFFKTILGCHCKVCLQEYESCDNFIYFDDISMYSRHMPFGQSVMNEEHIFNAAVSFKTCTKTLSNAFEFGAASYYLKVSKYSRTTFHSIISYSS